MKSSIVAAHFSLRTRHHAICKPRVGPWRVGNPLLGRFLALMMLVGGCGSVSGVGALFDPPSTRQNAIRPGNYSGEILCETTTEVVLFGISTRDTTTRRSSASFDVQGSLLNDDRTQQRTGQQRGGEVAGQLVLLSVDDIRVLGDTLIVETSLRSEGIEYDCDGMITETFRQLSDSTIRVTRGSRMSCLADVGPVVLTETCEGTLILR